MVKRQEVKKGYNTTAGNKVEKRRWMVKQCVMGEGES